MRDYLVFHRTRPTWEVSDYHKTMHFFRACFAKQQAHLVAMFSVNPMLDTPEALEKIFRYTNHVNENWTEGYLPSQDPDFTLDFAVARARSTSVGDYVLVKEHDKWQAWIVLDFGWKKLEEREIPVYRGEG